MKDYKKILEGIMNIINTTEKSDIGFANICTYIGENCPELKESEDDNIRRWIINEIKIKHHNLDEDNVDFVDKAIAWLEKRGEQKPTEWSEEDEKLVKNLISTLSNLYARNLIEKETKEKYTDLLKSLKERLQLHPTWKPSDEQMKAIQESVGIIGELTPRGECLKELEEQLKKLREE